jgi:1-deoxy-D-xylulose-5-phosphate synthase
VHKRLTEVRTSPLYNRIRDEVKRLVHAGAAHRHIGEMVEHFAGARRRRLQGDVRSGMLFEELGFRYVGPVDGHDVASLVDTFEQVRKMKGPRLVHVPHHQGEGVRAGRGGPGEVARAGRLRPHHRRAAQGRPPRAPALAERLRAGADELGRRGQRTWWRSPPRWRGHRAPTSFQKAHPERFFDVGIAEGHAVTFAAGLATQGIKPVVAIYSTFLQRAYDSIEHDVALQELPGVPS